MKLTVSRETFLTQLSVVARAASTRSAIQTLAGVLIRLEDGQAELQATDTDLGIRATLDAEIAAEGAVVVPGRLLLDVARSLPKDSLSLEYRSSEQDVEVVSGLGQVPPPDPAARGLPEAARGRPDERAGRASRRVHRDDRPRRALRLAR